MRTVALEPPTEHRRKDSDKRLIAGVIERYGEPEERMGANYRRYVREYPLVGQALRSMAAEERPALIHCVNGKDRTGVLCATLLRATGADEDAIMEDYLRVNADHADLIAEEAAHLDGGMTDHERAILLSFLEARPAYLRAYFDEIDRLYGSFATYLREGPSHPEAIELFAPWWPERERAPPTRAPSRPTTKAYRMRRLTSFSWRPVTALGAPVMGVARCSSSGKAMTSRMESQARSITRRSSPARCRRAAGRPAPARDEVAEPSSHHRSAPTRRMALLLGVVDVDGAAATSKPSMTKS